MNKRLLTYLLTYIGARSYSSIATASPQITQVQTWSPKWRFFGEKGLNNIKYSHRDPQKALPYPERRLFHKNPFKGVSCSLIQEPKNEQSRQKHDKITYLGSRNPWTDRYKILHAGCRPGRNQAGQFL